jgi:flagellar basal body-associated protein FliL
MPKVLALVVGVTVVEAIGFFAVTRLLGGGPEVAYGEQGQHHLLDGQDPGSMPQTVEIELLKRFRVPNDKGGRLYIYDLDISVKVPGHRKAEVEQLVAERTAEISDRVARLVRGSDPAVVHEPDLKTLRMQIQHVVGEIAGDQGIVTEVLIPRCVPTRSD